ncbi:hypothetical protein [Sodalis sp.]
MRTDHKLVSMTIIAITTLEADSWEPD